MKELNELINSDDSGKSDEEKVELTARINAINERLVVI